MAIEGFPNCFGYNGILVPATPGFAEVFEHKFGNPNDVAAPGVTVTDL